MTRESLKVTQSQLRKMLYDSYRISGCEDHITKMNEYDAILNISIDDLAEDELENMVEQLANVFAFILDLDDGLAGIDWEEVARQEKAKKRWLLGLVIPCIPKRRSLSITHR